MPRNSNNSKSGDDYVLPSFVSCELSDAEKDKCRANLMEPDAILETLSDLAGNGYKITVSYDNRSDCVSAFLTATEGQRTNKGLAISSRAPDAQGALTVLFYKHFEKLKENWADNESAAKKSVWG